MKTLDSTVVSIVAETMNILEKDFGIEELESYGQPTVEDIAQRIIEEHSWVVAAS